jgi:hypothetical protein
MFNKYLVFAFNIFHLLETINVYFCTLRSRDQRYFLIEIGSRLTESVLHRLLLYSHVYTSLPPGFPVFLHFWGHNEFYLVGYDVT